MWIVIRIDHSRPQQKYMKQNMIEVANTFSKNEKICKEIQNYSINKIKNGSFEYIEVIETLKRNKK